MRILVASTFVPFVRGGDARIVDDLCDALRERDHEVDTILLPHLSDPQAMVEQLLSFRLLDVSHAGDVLISIRTPSYLLRHPNKVVWFIHHHRPAYDLWGTAHQDLPDTPEGLALREPILRADDIGLHEARRVYANSNVTAERLRRFNGVDAEVLYPPLAQTAEYSSRAYGDYVFFPSRITPIKRQELVVRAMSHVRTPVRLVVAGSPDVTEHLESLERLIAELHVGDRVELIGRWITEDEKRDLYADALAVAYPPYDEDSYGYVTLEAFESARAVVTCDDAGGVLELVDDETTGLVVPAHAESLARAFDRLYDDRNLARELGEAGRASIREREIGWERVVDELLA